METIQQELEFIRTRNDGLLKPSDVVEFAKDEGTKLHTHFNWDDSSAAHHYRLWQARQIIKVNVTMMDVGEKEPIMVKTYVSLTPDRGVNGYRALTDVMSHEDLRFQLMMDAKRELKAFHEKYKALNILEKHIMKAEEALDKSIKAHEKKTAKQPMTLKPALNNA